MKLVDSGRNTWPILPALRINFKLSTMSDSKSISSLMVQRKLSKILLRPRALQSAPEKRFAPDRVRADGALVFHQSITHECSGVLQIRWSSWGQGGFCRRAMTPQRCNQLCWLGLVRRERTSELSYSTWGTNASFYRKSSRWFFWD